MGLGARTRTWASARLAAAKAASRRGQVQRLGGVEAELDLEDENEDALVVEGEQLDDEVAGAARGGAKEGGDLDGGGALADGGDTFDRDVEDGTDDRQEAGAR